MTFNLLKSVKWSLLILALTIGCKPEEINEPTVYNVDASLAKYVDKFFQEANTRGITISKENLIVKPAINTSDFTDICGKCTQNSKFPELQRTVEINMASSPCWKNISENDKEALVFHELGHCLLNRIAHKNDTFADGSPKSIMVANNTDLYGPCIYTFDENPTLCNKTNRRKYYIDELFDEKTATPSWAR
jgi:hypothetical protein